MMKGGFQSIQLFWELPSKCKGGLCECQVALIKQRRECAVTGLPEIQQSYLNMRQIYKLIITSVETM